MSPPSFEALWGDVTLLTQLHRILGKQGGSSSMEQLIEAHEHRLATQLRALVKTLDAEQPNDDG